ncbi:MAG: GTP-binding protein, partial [Acidobacteriia bacterium]|nr:GTP-binding protein [Terriglobia bacterium]
MRNIIVGTAGHIDHGKTSLVRALTGIDADRLAEEKRRGITIDLGFAHLQVGSDLRLGFVDVPGHERFVRNMLAGAAGIDVVLFVVAADESIKPQTREHFEICRMLGVRAGVVAITRADLVDPELVDLVRLEVEEFVQGSFLETAPKIGVSAVTGAGLPELLAALETTARSVMAKSARGWFRMPVDRAFTMRGFGSVVTGMAVIDSMARVAVTTVGGYASVPVSNVVITSIEQTVAGACITNQGTLAVSGLEAGAHWSYSLDGGNNWSDGAGTSFTLP